MTVIFNVPALYYLQGVHYGPGLFMGNGSTAVTAIRTEHFYPRSKIDAAYCQLAQSQVADAVTKIRSENK